MKRVKAPKLRFRKDDGSEFPEWEEKTLFDVLDNVVDFRGRTPKKLGMDWSSEKTDYLALSALNVKMGYIDDSVDPHYGDSILYHRWMNGKELYKGEVLFTTEAPMGNIAQVPDDKPYILSQRVIALIPVKAVICEDFLCCVLQSGIVQLNLKTLATGGTAQGISQKSLEKLRLTFPSLPEQKKIASFLSTIDEIIQSTESELNAWQERKKGVMQKIFNREVRFKADDGSEFPEWKEKKIGEICVINPKTEEVEDEFLYMDLGSVDHGDWEEPEVMIKSKAPSRAQRVARVGDVFFQSVRPYNQGHFHYSEKKDKQVVASTGYIQIRMKNCDSGFIYQILYDAHFNQEVSIRCTGSNYPAINADDFSEIVIAYPCVEEQRKIAECLSSLDDVINQIDAELSAWKEFKKGLLQQMFV